MPDMYHMVSRSPARTGATPALRPALLVAICCSLFMPVAERSPGAGALAAQDAAGTRAGGLKRIQPGHYDRAVTDIDLPQYHRFQGYSPAMEMAVRRVYQELTTGLD